jgi:hypothetical protein
MATGLLAPISGTIEVAVLPFEGQRGVKIGG